MAEEFEPGASVHLAFEHLRAGVHALGAAIVMWCGHRRGHGGMVLQESPRG